MSASATTSSDEGLTIQPSNTRIARLGTLSETLDYPDSFYFAGFVDPESGDDMMLIYVDRPCSIHSRTSELTIDVTLARAGLQWLRFPKTATLPNTAILAFPKRTIIYSVSQRGAKENAAPPTLTLVGVNPSPNSPVDENTVVVADLKFSVPDVAAGKYFIMAEFDTTNPMKTFEGTFPNQLFPAITTPEGELQFDVPLKYVWSSPELKHPITLRFYLVMQTDAGHGTPVARTNTFMYVP